MNNAETLIASIRAFAAARKLNGAALTSFLAALPHPVLERVAMRMDRADALPARLTVEYRHWVKANETAIGEAFLQHEW